MFKLKNQYIYVIFSDFVNVISKSLKKTENFFHFHINSQFCLVIFLSIFNKNEYQ